MPEHPVIDAAERFRAQLLRMERDQAMRYVNAYGRIFSDLRPMIETLQAEIARMEVPTAEAVERLARWKALRRQIAEEVARFGQFVDTDMMTNVQTMISLGLQHGEQMTLAGLPEPLAAAIRTQWNRLPVDAVRALLGFLAPGSPLHSALVEQLGDAVAAGVERALLRGITLGQNPRTIAEIIRREMGQALTWALRTVRTAQLWAYREANRASYVANGDIVEGWVWHAKLGDGRTCMSCIAQHGSIHPVTEVLNDHHNGRCAMVPLTVSWESLGFPGLPDTRPSVSSGEAWFTGLSEAEQQRTMGPAMWRAWKAGEVRWEDLSRAHTDPVYGEMRTAASLRALLGSGAREYYRARN